MKKSSGGKERRESIDFQHPESQEKKKRIKRTHMRTRTQ